MKGESYNKNANKENGNGKNARKGEKGIGRKEWKKGKSEKGFGRSVYGIEEIAGTETETKIEIVEEMMVTGKEKEIVIEKRGKKLNLDVAEKLIGRESVKRS